MNVTLRIISILLLKFALPIAIVICLRHGKQWIRSLREGTAASWPAGPGHVISGTVKRLDGNKRSLITFYEVALSYTYKAQEYQAGTYKQIFKSEDQADEFVRNLKGKEIQVRYSPTNERKSCLRSEDLQVISPMGLSPYGTRQPASARTWIWKIIRPLF